MVNGKESLQVKNAILTSQEIEIILNTVGTAQNGKTLRIGRTSAIFLKGVELHNLRSGRRTGEMLLLVSAAKKTASAGSAILIGTNIRQTNRRSRVRLMLKHFNLEKEFRVS